MHNKTVKQDPQHNNTEKHKQQKVSSQDHGASQAVNQSVSQPFSQSASQPASPHIHQQITCQGTVAGRPKASGYIYTYVYPSTL